MVFGTIHLSYLQDHLGILAKGDVRPSPHFAVWRVESTTLLWPLWFRHYHENTCRSMMEQTDGTSPIDGKFMLGTKIGDGRSPDVVTAFSVTDRLPLDTEMCGVKSNEIKAAPKSLSGLTT